MSQEPLIRQEPQLAPPQENEQAPPPKNIYKFLATLFVASLSQAITSQASNDAKYLIICKWASIDKDHCFKSPEASTLEGVLLGWVNIFGGVAGIASLLILSHCINIYGIRPVFIGTLAVSFLQLVAYWLLLVSGPQVHYLWTVVPEVLANFTLYASAQFLASIYISELVTNVKTRTIYLGWMTGVISALNIVGPLIGGAILRRFEVSTLYAYTIPICGFGFLAVLKNIQESHVQAEKKPSVFESIKLIPCNFIEDPTRRKTTRKLVAFVVGSSVLSNTVSFVQTIYVKSKFGWTASENGLLSSVGETISIISVAILSPIIIKHLSDKFSRFDHDYDQVDASLTTFHVLINLLVAVIKSVLPFPKTFFGAQSFSQFDSISSSTILNNSFKYAPPGLLTSFWVGIVYLVQLVMIPVVTLTLSLYTHILTAAPESIFYAAIVGWSTLLVLVWTIAPKLK